MTVPLYALVAYVKNPVGEFVEALRRDLHPEQPHMAAHLTILPPRQLRGSEEEAREIIQEVCRKVEPFEVVMGDVEDFVPLTPTIFIRVAHAAYRIRELHDKLNTGPLYYEEPWPYMPHLTIVKLADDNTARRGAEEARLRWARYLGSRRVLVEELSFVRSGGNLCEWSDLVPIRLGRREQLVGR